MKIVQSFLLLILLLSGTPANAEESFQLNIEAGELSRALNDLALQTGVALYFEPEAVRGKTTQGLKGQYSLEQGFRQLLQQTNLQFHVAGGAYFIELDSITSENDLTLDTLDVYASNLAHTDIYQEPSSASKLDLEQLERTAARDTSDLFQHVSGVTTSQSRQNPGVAINIRGLQDFGRVNAMIDGIRQNYQRSDHSSNSSVYVDPLMIGAVEVNKGPTSRVGGSGVNGGMVNFKTVGAEDLIKEGETSGHKISLTGGNNNYYFHGGAFSAVKSGNTSLVAGITRKNIGEFKKGRQGGKAVGESDLSSNSFTSTSQYTAQDHWSGLFKASHQWNDDHWLEFGFVGYKTSFAEGNDSPNVDQPADSESELINLNLRLKHRYQPDNSMLDLHSQLYFSRTADSAYRPNKNGYGEFDLRYQINTVGLTSENLSVFEYQDFGSEFLWTNGFEIYQDKTNPSVTHQTPGVGDESFFSGTTPGGKRIVGGLFTELEWQHQSGFGVIAGFRYDRYSLSGGGEVGAGSIQNPAGVNPGFTRIYTNFDVERHDQFYLPSLTLLYQLAEPLQLYASVRKAARPPHITETLQYGNHVGFRFPFSPNPGLIAERTTAKELGLNLMLEGIWGGNHNFWLKASVYEYDTQDYISLAPVMGASDVEAPKNPPFSFVNMYGNTTTRGGEIQADYDSPYAFMELAFARTTVDLPLEGYNEFPLGSQVGFPVNELGNEGVGGLWVYQAPTFSATLTLGGKALSQQLKFALRIRDQDNDLGGTWGEIIDWTVYDAWIKYQYSDAISLRLAVDNFKDQNYAEAAGLAAAVAPGRTITFNTTMKF